MKQLDLASPAAESPALPSRDDSQAGGDSDQRPNDESPGGHVPSGGNAGLVVAGNPPPPQTTALDRLPAWGVGDSWLAEYERMAVRVAQSVALPVGIRGDARNVLAIALAGRELGIGFMEATRQIDLIEGATALRSELKMALARRAGLMVDEIQATATGCTITAHRKDTGESATVNFTEADKKAAGLGLKERSAWRTYPEDMYYARASARLIRRLMPDARGASFRTVEELSEDVREDTLS